LKSISVSDGKRAADVTDAAAAVVVRVENRVAREAGGGGSRPQTDTAAIPVSNAAAAAVGMIGVERVGVEDGVSDDVAAAEAATKEWRARFNPAGVAGDSRCAVPSRCFRLRVSIKQKQFPPPTPFSCLPQKRNQLLRFTPPSQFALFRPFSSVVATRYIIPPFHHHP